MGAWDTDNHGTLFSVLGGIAVLVFAGIGVSLVVDNRASSSATVIELRERVARQRRTIHEMETRRELLTSRWEQTLGYGDHESLGRELSGQLDGLRGDRRRLERRIDGLETETRNLVDESRDYRRRYHLAARRAAVGETFDTFTLPDGRSYSEVEIIGHDDEGLRIRHAHGTGKLSYADLPAHWKDRLQWSPLPPDPAPAPQDASLTGSPTESAGPADSVAPAEDRDAERRQRIDEARARTLRHRTDYRKALREASIARSKSLGSERSVPGTLETWAERAERMRRVADQIRELYIEARADLTLLSPNDPLLRDEGF